MMLVLEAKLMYLLLLSGNLYHLQIVCHVVHNISTVFCG